jgi:uncharacterized repeat protein (TIGR01451 family)
VPGQGISHGAPEILVRLTVALAAVLLASAPLTRAAFIELHFSRHVPSQTGFPDAQNTFDGDIAANDLINAGSPSFLSLSSTGTTTGGGTPDHANDGLASGDTSTGGSGDGLLHDTFFSNMDLTSNPSITFDLDLNHSPSGYTIRRIVTIHGWQSNPTFSNQKYTVAVKTINNPNFTDVASVDYEPFTTADDSQPDQPNSSKVVLLDGSATPLTGVTALRFTYSAATNQTGGQVIREIDVYATAPTGDFLAYRDTSGNLALMNSDGSGKVVIASDYFAVQPVLNAARTFVAFNGAHGTESGIFVMKVGSSEPPVLVVSQNPVSRLAWHTNGRQLVYLNNDANNFPHVFVAKVVNAQRTITPVGAGNPATQLTNDPADQFASEETPAVSPTGRQLAFTRRGSTIYSLTAFAADGTPTPESSSNQAVALTRTDQVAPTLPQSTWVSFNPDGRKIVFKDVQVDSQFQNPKSRLSVLTIRDGGGTLTPETAGNLRVPYTQLVDGSFVIDQPSWSTDGALIAFQANPNAQSQASNVFTILSSEPENGTTNVRSPLTTTAEGGGFHPAFAQQKIPVPLNTPSFNLDSDIATTMPLQNGKKWTFKARLVQPLPDDTTVRVQASTDPDNEPSWTDIPGGNMDNGGGTAQTWVVTTTNVPAGSNLHFRVIANSGSTDKISEVRGPFNVGVAAPVLRLSVTANVNATFRGDHISYTLHLANDGGVTAANVVMRNGPINNTTRPADGSDDGSADYDMATDSLVWNAVTTIGPESDLERSFGRTVDPNTPLGTIIANTDVNVRAMSVSTVEADDLFLTVQSPLEITCTRDVTNIVQGGVVTFTLKVKNRALSTARDVVIENPLPVGGFFLRNGAGQPYFLDPDGDPGKAPKVKDPATGKVIKPNPLISADRKKVTWFCGDLEGGAERSVKFGILVLYDADTTQPMTNQMFTASGIFAGSAVAQSSGGTPVTVMLQKAAAGAPKPDLGLAAAITGAGTYQEAISGQTVATVAYPTAESEGTDVLRFEYLYYNVGGALAEYLNLHVLIPQNTHLVDRGKKTVTINGKGVENFTTSTSGGFTYLDVPLDFLEAGKVDTGKPDKDLLKILKAKGAAALLAFEVQLNPGLPADQFIVGLGGELTSETLRKVTYGAPAVLPAQVREGVTYSVFGSKTRLAPDRKPNYSQLIFFKNEGGVTSTDALLEFSLPAGAKFRKAQFLDKKLKPVEPPLAPPDAPAVNATTGTVKFHLGTVEAGSTGAVRIDLTEVAGAPTTGEDASKLVSGVKVSLASSSSLSHTAGRNLAQGIGSEITFSLRGSAEFIATPAKLYVALLAPQIAHPGDFIDYVLTWGNCSGSTPNGTDTVNVNFYLPVGTSFVSTTAPSGWVTSFNPPGTFTDAPAGSVFIFNDNQTFNGTHSSHSAVIRVQVNNDPTLQRITPEQVSIAGSPAEKRYGPPYTTIIVPPGTSEQSVRWQIINENGGATAEDAVGRTPSKTIQNIGFLNDAALVGQDAAGLAAGAGFSVAGADFIHTKNGALVIPLGGGNIVAAGGGNIVAGGGGNIVAGGGGNIVAGGGGNLISVVGVGALNADNVATFARAIVNQSNIVAAGGGNIVAGGGGNLVGQDAAGLSFLISNLTGTNLDQITAKIPGVIARGGALAGKGAADIVKAEALFNLNKGAIVAAGGGNIVAGGGGNIVAGGGGNIKDAKVGLAAVQGPKVMTTGTNSIVAAGGGNAVANDGAGIVINQP